MIPARLLRGPVAFGLAEAGALRRLASTMRTDAEALLGWAEANPVDTGLAGLDFPLARVASALASGACERATSRLGISGSVLGCDLETLEAMEGALATARVRLSAWEAGREASQSESLAGVIALGAAVVGVLGAVF